MPRCVEFANGNKMVSQVDRRNYCAQPNTVLTSMTSNSIAIPAGSAALAVRSSRLYEPPLHLSAHYKEMDIIAMRGINIRRIGIFAYLWSHNGSIGGPSLKIQSSVLSSPILQSNHEKGPRPRVLSTAEGFQGMMADLKG